MLKWLQKWVENRRKFLEVPEIIFDEKEVPLELHNVGVARLWKPYPKRDYRIILLDDGNISIFPSGRIGRLAKCDRTAISQLVAEIRSTT